MRYLSQEELIKQKDKISDGSSKLFMHCLITMCKELPDQQWQTIEEFKANPIEGPCHVVIEEEKMVLFFRNKAFWATHTGNRLFVFQNDITHVMPIKTPESPK